MYYIFPPRNGKTIKMIELSAEQNVQIVSIDKNQAERIAEIAENMGVNILPPISLEDIKKRKEGCKNG